jgi:hypothetical protein
MGDLKYKEIFDNLRQRLLNWMQESHDPLLKGPMASPFYDYGKEKLTAD